MAITLETLIEDLNKLKLKVPKNTKVLLSQDEEGNGFRALYQIETYHATDEGRGNYEIEEPDKEKPVNAIVLWPA